MRAYLARHWEGDLSLAVAYWANGVLVSAGAATLACSIGRFADVGAAPRLWSALLTTFWLGVIALSFWQIVGVWRSAGRHVERGGHPGWATAARVAVVIGATQAAAIVATQAAPQLWEFGKLVAGRDPISGYEIRSLRDGSELEVSGFIAFGLTGRVAAALDANPGATLIHLNMAGGRVAEARKLRDLIAARRLSTYTANQCISACVIPFLAGERRLVAADAKIGFHQYTIGGQASAYTLADMETDKTYFRSRGVSDAFVERAFRATDTLWYPTYEEMLSAGYITGRASRDEVALSGMTASEIDKLDASLQKEPLYAALAEYEPDAYQQISAAVKEGFQRGQSVADLRTRTLPVLQEVYRKRLPFASDEAVISYGHVLLDQIDALRSDPARCIAYMARTESGGDVRAVFGEALVQRETSVMADVIRTAASGSSRPPAEEEVAPVRAEVSGRLLASFSPAELAQLAHPDRIDGDPVRACDAFYTFYSIVLDLPASKSSAMLRDTFATAAR